MALDDKGCCTHAEDQPVSATVKRQSRLLDHVVGCCGTGGCKAACNPLPQVVARDVVAADDDHAVHAAGVEPVLSDAKRRRRRCTSEVDRGVGSTDARVLCEL